MIFTIGYQQFKTLQEFINRLKSEGITHLVDVRSKPWSRKKGFNKNQIAAEAKAAGIDYSWQGDRLGGFAAITNRSIEELAAFQVNRRVCIMCMEADPDRCHRKQNIGRLLEERGITVNHFK